MEEGDGERDTSLLATTQSLDESVARWQIQQCKEELHLRLDEARRQLVDAAEILERLLDRELAVEGQLLRHVADSTARDSRFRRARLTAKDEHFAAVEASSAHNAAQQCCLAATTGAQQSISKCVVRRSGSSATKQTRHT